MEPAKPYEMVNHPSHYGGADNPYEVVKVLEAWLTRDQMIGWLRGTAIKYMARAGKKPGNTGEQDLAKARWYTDYEIEFVKRVPLPVVKA